MSFSAPVPYAGQPSSSEKDDGPEFDVRKGDVVTIASPTHAQPRTLVCAGRIPASIATQFQDAQPATFWFTEVPDGNPVFLTNKQISILCKSGEFAYVVVKKDGELRTDHITPLGLTDKELKTARLRKRYVDLCISLGDRFRRCRKVLDPHIEALASQIGGKKYSTTTVLKWYDDWQKSSPKYGIASLVNQRGQGNKSRPWSDLLLQAMRNCIYRSLQSPKPAAADALALLRIWIDDKFPETSHQIKLPHIRTVQREMAKIDLLLKAFLNKGYKNPKRRYASYYERPRPDLPLEEVEVDHTLFDVRCIDEESGLVLGRPDIITFRCRRTGMCLGFGLGWEFPSYAAFLEGARHAMYEKDLSSFPSVKSGWPCRGRWKRLYVDNALHFIGLNIQHAANELNFEIVELRPGQPWLKGAEERLQGIINRRVAHSLPGSTMSNINERKEFEESLNQPHLTLQELEAFLIYYICEEYHQALHEGLGPLRSLKDVPSRLWHSEIGKVKIRDLPHPDVFAALAGDIDERTIRNIGIEWDYITYQSEDLIAIRSHPRHKPGHGRHKGTMYRVTRDPQDLGHIWIFDPYRKVSLQISATRSDYAAGLTLHQHRVIIAHHKRISEADVDVDALLRARGILFEAIERIRKSRKTHGVERKMARFLGAEKAKRLRSRVSLSSWSAAASAAHIDIEEPVAVAAPEIRATRALRSTRRTGGPDGGSAHCQGFDGDSFHAFDSGAAATASQPQVREAGETGLGSDAFDYGQLRSQHRGWEDV